MNNYNDPPKPLPPQLELAIGQAMTGASPQLFRLLGDMMLADLSPGEVCSWVADMDDGDFAKVSKAVSKVKIIEQLRLTGS